MVGQDAPNGWKQFDDFADGIAANRLPATAELTGQTLRIALDNARSPVLRFVSAHSVAWTDGERSGTDACEAVAVAPGVYFISMTFSDAPLEDETFVVSTRTRRVVSIRERVRAAREAPGEPRVDQIWSAGALCDPAAAATGPKPGPTRDLIGMTAHYRYSDNHLYEHVYLSSQRYAWQNLVGVQRGHGDVDLATTWKFDDNQYLFGFREFIIPVASVFFYNWSDMRSTGKFLGVTSAGNVESKPAGAFIRHVSRAVYEPAAEPV